MAGSNSLSLSVCAKSVSPSCKSILVHDLRLKFVIILKHSDILIAVVAYSALAGLFLVIGSKIYWYVMVFLLKKMENVPEADPLYKVSLLFRCYFAAH